MSCGLACVCRPPTAGIFINSQSEFHGFVGDLKFSLTQSFLLFSECLHSLEPSALSRLFFCTLAPTTKCPQKVFYSGRPCLSLTLPLHLLVTESLFFFFFFHSAPVSPFLCFSPGIGRIVSKLAFCFFVFTSVQSQTSLVGIVNPQEMALFGSTQPTLCLGCQKSGIK